ncbi:2'-5' RNA ligase family protein [Robertkochia sediminum]|uniref:2'-5' RNA ligase family protein n=1 Tax=Robertkochia sediminum TaxID=2785326 RepID=UPI0019315337|nr:2'-5' RNA ligase family protein [Robertkochia sediminum]MBL7471909.1 2'-5' RNA ligase family protein [Robertkochia sediminum]
MKIMYYIAVLPPEDIRSEIKVFKEEVLQDFGSGHALRSPAHITLQMPFHFEEAQESQLITALASLAKSHHNFSCTAEGLGHFGDRTIFIAINPNTTLNNLRINLQVMLRETFGFGDKKLPQRFHPHITIANRDLTPERFPACWDAFRDRTYTRDFGITGIALLKHRGDHWEVYREFPFN